MSSNPLDLLGDLSTPQASSIGLSPVHSQPQTHENTMSLLDDDLLGGGLSRGSQQNLEFLGYEDTVLTIQCKCSKVV